MKKKKFPYFIGMGMIVVGIISMLISGQVGEQARQFIVFAGIVVFIAGFAGTVIYATVKDAPQEEKKEKRPMTRAKIMLLICGIICLAGLIALIAGFVLFADNGMIVCLIGMAAFLGGGSGMISVFTRHKSEFIEDDQSGENADESNNVDK